MGWPGWAFGMFACVPAIVMGGCCVRVSVGLLGPLDVCAYCLW